MAEELTIDELGSLVEAKRIELRLTAEDDRRNTALAELLILENILRARGRALSSPGLSSQSYGARVAPAPEASEKGEIASDPSTLSRSNEDKLRAFEGHPWEPAILKCHGSLQSLIPGYRILRIESALGGLTYDFSYPAIPISDLPWSLDEDKIKGMVEQEIARAQGWVQGYEHFQSNDLPDED